MQTLRFTHTADLRSEQPMSEHVFTLRILPADDPAQTISFDSVEVAPTGPLARQTDGFSNTLLVGSSREPHDYFSYRVSGTATVDSTRGRGTLPSPLFAVPSPLCVPGPAISALDASAGGPGITGPSETSGACSQTAPTDIFERALELCALVHDEMTYAPGSTSVDTTAEEAASQRAGVCQDFAHILSALLRLEGIPARYVCGLMIGEGATHAWTEFSDGQTWWGLDPTNNCEAGDYYIALARGRDHADCPMERGVFRGGAMQRLETQVTVELVSP